MEALRALSAETGKSIAELTRQAVNLLLQQQRHEAHDVIVERASSIAGRFASGVSDISSDHDRYLAEAFEE